MCPISLPCRLSSSPCSNPTFALPIMARCTDRFRLSIQSFFAGCSPDAADQAAESAASGPRPPGDGWVSVEERFKEGSEPVMMDHSMVLQLLSRAEPECKCVGLVDVTHWQSVPVPGQLRDAMCGGVGVAAVSTL